MLEKDLLKNSNFVVVCIVAFHMHFLSQTAVKSSIPGAASVVDITQKLADNCFQLAKDKFGSKVGPTTSLLIVFLIL